MIHGRRRSYICSFLRSQRRIEGALLSQEFKPELTDLRRPILGSATSSTSSSMLASQAELGDLPIAAEPSVLERSGSLPSYRTRPGESSPDPMPPPPYISHPVPILAKQPRSGAVPSSLRRSGPSHLLRGTGSLPDDTFLVYPTRASSADSTHSFLDFSH
jgi:hypothetical protein